MSCPSTAELVNIAFADVAADDAAVRHVQGCAYCAAQVRQWRAIAAAVQLEEDEMAAEGNCLDEMTVAAIASGNAALLTSDVQAHLAQCARCRMQLAGAIETLRAPEIVAELDRLEMRAKPRPRRTQNWLAGGLLAAALTGVVLAPQFFRARSGDTLNRARDLRDTDPTITKTVAPRIVAPVGVVSKVNALSWTNVPGAGRYDVRIFTDQGTVVWETQTNDTRVALPRTVELQPGSVYFYQVEAHTSFGRSVQSELAEFRIDNQGR